MKFTISSFSVRKVFQNKHTVHTVLLDATKICGATSGHDITMGVRVAQCGCLSMVLGALLLWGGAFAQPPSVPPPFAGPGIGLAPIFTDHAVLQRAPAVSAVFGVVVGDSHATGATVTISSDADGTSYSVAAEHIERVNATYFRWKAALRPTESTAGSHTISAACIGCQASSIGSAQARDIVFGDVYVCSGRTDPFRPPAYIRAAHSPRVRLSDIVVLTHILSRVCGAVNLVARVLLL